MKIASALLGLLFFVCVFSLSGCSAVDTAGHEGKKELTFAQVDRHDVLHTCPCGLQCNCSTVSTKPGKCDCGRALKWAHVLKREGTEAILCQSDERCQCYLKSKDTAKCSCGSSTKRVSLVGTGIYFCKSGASSFCNYVSDSSGKCKCGSELIKAG